MIAGMIDPALSGYRPAYSSGTSCPSCASRAWHVGRQSAECARCGTALPLAPVVVPLDTSIFEDAH